MKVAFFNTKPYEQKSFEAQLDGSGHDFTFFEAKLDLDTAPLAKGFDAICSFVNDHLDQAILEKLNGFGINKVVLRCAGFNQIDLEAAKVLDFTICRVPAYSPEAVAEHSFALLLTLSRKTHKAFNRVRDNNFSLVGLTGFNIHQKTIGVIGTGAIGKAFIRIAMGFGCRILAYDLYPDQKMKDLGVSYLPLEDVLNQSDILSLHCPLTEDSFHMINKKALQKMKAGVTIINTSRGALINTKDAISGLKKGKIGFLGIDVYEQEENLFFQNLSEEILQDEQIARLMTFPNVLITGHQAFLTHEALSEIARVTLLNLDQIEAGMELDNQVKLG
ncbi:2-hydroxyacid dehydrogenase [Algoriphagus namhaensis]|uniref:2-hydroxyacid dehydrogenase n=1 Tax=Algoriphagus namhaensis TaxID=915353 RepID=A0ABV8AW46_9BACT